jgi:hypothetical protein
MEDDGRSGDGAGDGGGIPKIALDDLRMVAGRTGVVAQIRSSARGEVVEHADSHASVQKRPGQRRADEPGSSGNDAEIPRHHHGIGVRIGGQATIAVRRESRRVHSPFDGSWVFASLRSRP